ncbi:MAG TPA: ATP-dependent DNA helicase, partial [Rhodospirillaceae bacterium]|nr:ATP-dependent DNA helicase [Rhodospirillaceae bacterium]
MLEPAPALVAGVHEAAWLTVDGEVVRLPHKEAARRLAKGGPIYLLHAPATVTRISGRAGGRIPTGSLDLLELFAFVAPAKFCVPTPRGLAEALQLPIPGGLEDQAILLPRAAQRLL